MEKYAVKFIEEKLKIAGKISKNLDIYADIIEYISDGKIIMECWDSMFRYIRNLIVNSSNNPIKIAAVITLVG